MWDRKKYMREYRQKNKEKLARLDKEWREKNREHVRQYNIKYCEENLDRRRKASVQYSKTKNGKLSGRRCTIKKYGITLVDYNRMFAAQNGCCGICGRHQTEFKKSLAVDHNHTTGQIRGLLCISCNTGLTVVEDENRMKNSLVYLAKWNIKTKSA